MISPLSFFLLLSLLIYQNNALDCVAEVRGFDTMGFPPVTQTPYTCSSRSDSCAKVEGYSNGINYLFRGCNNDYISYIRNFDTFSNCTIDTCTSGRIRMQSGENLTTRHCCCATDKCNSSGNFKKSYFLIAIFITISIIFQKYL
uniref:Activin_recp domain-containing protein n=1 Tax=Strongyloides papillosus TaxID=174720 RepID=A0A0N5BV96_STREA